MLQAQLNDKVVGITKHDKIKKYWFTVCGLKSDELQFVNIFYATKAHILQTAEYRIMFVKLYY